jgi:NAD(P)-dependent dehydrogenase (short-subunit alcohol dehydrogenase family)
MNVAGARCLVVGGARRLGGALAADLAAHGAAVCVSSRDKASAAAAVSSLQAAGAATAAAVGGDVRTAAGARQLVADAAAALGGLDALVYAASGPFVPTRPEDLHEASWDASFETVAKGFFFSACAAREAFAEPGGTIVALTDYLGLQPWSTFAAHGAAKAAQIHLVKELARAWAGEGVRVCGVAPGPVDLDDDEHRAATLRAAARVAKERLVAPGDIGRAVRFCLATDGVTGVNVIVDNGSLVTS